MKAYYVEDLGLAEDEITEDGKTSRGKIYVAAEVDSRIADLEKDAERYRWLRAHSYVERMDLPDMAIIYGGGYQQTRPDFLDSDIDIAMSYPRPTEQKSEHLEPK